MGKKSKKTDIKECLKCKKKLVLINYYNSNSTLFEDNKSPICKSCIRSMIDYDDMKSIYSILRQMDIPFEIDYWNKAVESKRDTFSRYITMVNSLPQFQGKTWDDSIFNSEGNKSDKAINKDRIVDNVRYTSVPKIEKFKVTEELMDKWGFGYTPEEYRLFEKKYKRLINNYGEKTALHTEGLITYIRYRVKEEMATAKGNVKESKEWGQLASKAAQDAKINVSQLSKSDLSGGVDLLPQLFEAVESEVGIISILPHLKEQPYDDADLIIWCVVNYLRRLEGKSRIQYRNIWDFYDEMLTEHFKQKGYSESAIQIEKEKRNDLFRDLGEVYKEPIYEEEGN